MIAALAGSFDPFTKGHRWLVQQGLKLFGPDQVVVILADNPEKKYLFTDEERLKIVHLSLDDLVPRALVRRLPAGALAAKWAKEYCGIKVMLRGLRDAKDLDYECEVEHFNRKECGVDSVFFLAQHTVSSTSLRQGLTWWRADGGQPPTDANYATKEAQAYVESCMRPRAMPPRKAAVVRSTEIE